MTLSPMLVDTTTDTLSGDIAGHFSDPDIEGFLRLHVLLYADDTIGMAETRTIAKGIKYCFRLLFCMEFNSEYQ